MVKLKMIQKRSCMNCLHLRKLPDLPVRDRTQTGGYVSCDMDWFWNKFRKERHNLMRRITLEKKGEWYARECPDFCSKHVKEMERKRTKEAELMNL